MGEFEQKQERIRELLNRHHLDALLLQRASSFAWATCGGRSYVNTASSDGVGSLLITPTGRYFITDNIEARRLEREEGLADQEWQFYVSPWYSPARAVHELAGELKLGSDGLYVGAMDLAVEISHLRANLLPEEGQRFQELSRICAVAMDTAIRQIHPGQTEFEIAGLLAQQTLNGGAEPIVNLVATDARIFEYRHPLPTSKKMERYAMLVLCGRKWGLVCSITRLVHFGRLTAELKEKQEACARVDADFIANTRPGRHLGEIFREAQRVYAESGNPQEWQLHHQGGPAGYEPREWIATPDSTEPVALGQVYAWNPSITGTKSEDTILVGPVENQVLTSIDGWPTLSVSSPSGRPMKRPAILEID